MNERIADALVLAFSEGVSLRVWSDSGLLEREWELYRRVSGRFGAMTLLTYGGADDRAVLERMGPGVKLVCNSGNLPARQYVEAAPAMAAQTVADARTVVVKTNQMSGGEAALGVTRALRAAGKHAALIARGGYLWSQFAAWESGASSPAAIDAGEREGRLCRGADLVVGTTQQMVDDLAWRHGISESRLQVVPNYVVGAARRGLEREAGVVLYVGRLAAQKRVDRLIDAMGRLKPALREGTVLWIVGDGPLREELGELAERRGVRVRFEGRIPHEQVLDRMRRCTIYAQASSYEGHPKTVIEAMSVGTPVLVTDSPGLRGVVRHGTSGLCVTPDAPSLALALEGLLEDAAWRRALGDAAAEQARQEFGLDRVVELEVAAYRRAVAQGTAQGTAEPDVARAVKWTPELLSARVPRMVEGWERSLRGFTQRLAPRARAEFLTALDGPLYHMQGEAAGLARGPDRGCMKVLYLSPNMANYGGAGYQHDVMEELRRQAEVFCYGPGFRSYHAGDTLADAMRKAGFAPDWILCGHAWLEDKAGAPVERFGHIDLTHTECPKAAILNKEYTNLEAKLEWMRRAGMSVVFTHHHDAAEYEQRTGIRCVFWPFAADHRLFHQGDEKTLDLGFSGILQNSTPGRQSDLRVRVMERLFECDGDVPVRARGWCRDLKIRFNAMPRSEAQRAAYQRMDTGAYAAFVRSCRAFLCTRSPADLVSPRYFECMLSRTLVIAERSAAHAAIFPPGCLIEFGDEAEFQERLLEAMRPGAAEAVVERAHREAVSKHTWEKRVAALLAELAGARAEAVA